MATAQAAGRASAVPVLPVPGAVQVGHLRRGALPAPRLELPPELGDHPPLPGPSRQGDGLRQGHLDGVARVSQG